MLKDVQAAMADHATLQQHLPKKEWLAAVPVLLRLANKYDSMVDCWPQRHPLLLSWIARSYLPLLPQSSYTILSPEVHIVRE